MTRGFSVMAGLDPAIHADTTWVALAWMPAAKGDLRSPSMQEDAKALPWLRAGMTARW